MSASVNDQIQPFQGWPLSGDTQGRRWCANPGLSEGNPFRIAGLPIFAASARHGLT